MVERPAPPQLICTPADENPGPESYIMSPSGTALLCFRMEIKTQRENDQAKAVVTQNSLGGGCELPGGKCSGLAGSVERRGLCSLEGLFWAHRCSPSNPYPLLSFPAVAIKARK